MSQLDDSYFARLAQKLPGLKRQVGEAIQKKRAKKNGHPLGPTCQICGKEFSVKTALVPGAPLPKYCPDCNKALEDGCGALVTIEAKPRYWIG